MRTAAEFQLAERAGSTGGGAGFNWWPPLLGAALLGVAIWAEQTHQTQYLTALAALMNRPRLPPFVDLHGVLESVQCWRQGVDVYVSSPCDVLHRRFNYSPMLLRMSFLPSDGASITAIGLGFAGAFFVSLGFLPRPSTVAGRVAATLGAFSSLTIFALERGNIDLLMFALLMVAAALLAGGGRRRAMGYALVLAAAAMKFYPLAALALALRERMRVTSVVFLFAAGISVWFALTFRSELAEILPPRPNTLGDTFGVNHLLRAFQDWASPLGGLAVLGTQLALVFLAVRAFARRPEIGEAFDSLPTLAQIQLLANAAIVVGCYFLLENIGYRAVFLLPPLFCFVRLAESAATVGARRAFGAVSAAMLVCLWMLSLQQIVALLFGGEYDPVSGSVAGYSFWTIRELLWSFAAGALGGLLVRFAARSQTAKDLEAWLCPFAGRLVASNRP